MVVYFLELLGFDMTVFEGWSENMQQFFIIMCCVAVFYFFVTFLYFLLKLFKR